MTQDEITQLARDAGLHVNDDGEINHSFFGSVNEGYRKFAILVAAKEREECAAWLRIYSLNYSKDGTVGHTVAKCAEIILSRG
jgi:folate-binding Fe-S cluster repair protein YgfZ